MKWLSKLGQALTKTSSKITGSIRNVVLKKKLDQDTLLKLEEILIAADLGTETARKLAQELGQSKFDISISFDEVKAALSKIIKATLKPVAGGINFAKAKPHVVLVCGVNGNGKTTTIGKIAHMYTSKKKKVVMAACDTFRSAAVEQLEIWAKRTKSQLIRGEQDADPASVAYKAVEWAQANAVDLVLIDTAGRLSNKKPLMEELAKVNKVIKKLIPDAPHDAVLILDATVGQHAIQQVEAFKEMLSLTGLIVTKLDGSAKAGIVVALAQAFGIPVLAVGVGEGIDDLDNFNADEFADNLLS
jgi:fused signal recognition particle receptor